MTTTLNTRRVLCELVIAVAICGGARHFIVGSAESAIADTRNQIEQLHAASGAQSIFGNLSPDQVSELQRITADRVREVVSRSAPGIDQTLLFDRISSLAAATGVRIDTLNPVAGPVSSPPALPPGVAPGTPAAADALAALSSGGAPPADRKLGLTLSFSGTYSDATNFISQLSASLGYVVIGSAQITPDDADRAGLVRVTINAQLHAFDTSAVKVAPTAPVTIYPQPIPNVPPAKAQVSGKETP
ncbi:MAG: hypothetical protein K2W85_07315 [Phycisphaerales bacterium]|nr:hypothetical protein [Phycisphaerales bacterium]